MCLRANGNISHFLFGSLSCSPAPESLKYKLKLSGRCRAFTANSTLQSIPDALHLSTSDRHFTRKLRSNRSSGEARREGRKGKKGKRGEEWECAEERLSGDWVGRKGSKEKKKTDAGRRERNGEKKAQQSR